MSTGSLLPLVLTPLAIVAGAGVAWIGNYHLQQRVHHHLRLSQCVDNLKQKLHDFVDFSAKSPPAADDQHIETPELAV